MKKSLFILFSIFTIISNKTNAQWERVGNKFGTITESDFRKLESYKANIAFESYDKINISRDSGKTWKQKLIPIPFPYFGHNSTNLHLTENGIYYFHTPFAGWNQDTTFCYYVNYDSLNWSKFSFKKGIASEKSYFQGRDSFVDYFTYNTSTYNPVTNSAVIYRTTKGKNDWTIVSQNYYRGYITKKDKTAFFTNDSFFVRNFSTSVIVSRYSIKKWSPFYLKQVKPILEDSTVIIYSNTNDSIMLSNDLGQNFNFLTPKPKSNILNLLRIGKNTIVHYEDDIVISRDNGKSWTSFLKENEGYKQFNNKIITEMIYQDSVYFILVATKDWQFGSSTTTNEVKYLYKLKEGDKKWTFVKYFNPMFTKSDGSIFSMISQSENIGKLLNGKYIAKNSTDLFISNDKGHSWDIIDKDTSIKVNNYFSYLLKDSIIYITDASDFVLVPKANNIFASKDEGKTWQKQNNFPLKNNWLIKGDTMVISGEFPNKSKGTYYSTKFPYDNWTLIPNSGEYILGFQDEHINILNAKGDIQFLKLDGTITKIIKPNLSGIISIAQKDNLFFVANGDTIKRSEDGGITWRTILTLKRITSCRDCVGEIKVSNSGELFYATYYDKEAKNGGIYASYDSGLSWSQIHYYISLINQYGDGPSFSNVSILDNLLFINNYSSFSEGAGLWRMEIPNLKFRPINGVVYNDLNKNGIKDSNETGLSKVKIKTTNNLNLAYSDSLGRYSMYVNTSQNDTLKIDLDNKYTVSKPAFYVLTEKDTIVNFGVHALQNVNDVKINVTALTPLRPGFNTTYQISYKNVGAITKSGKVAFTYNAKQTYVEATQAPTTNANNTLAWDYANLQPNETRTLKVTFKTAADVPIRTQLTNVATIEPIATDTFKTDNVDSLFQIVVGSYDPNDKQVSFLNTRQPPSVIDPNTEMTYTIRFQNTGNYQADFVRVTDTLSDKLDLTTLRVLATSHNYALTVKNKNVLQFEFNPIYLPDSTTNEKESHGFIKFAIKPKKTLTKDEVIKNTAYIFFDYNPAIITNTVETANQKVNGLFTPSVLESLSVFPNPTNGEISFSLDKYQGKALSINVYSIDGKLMMNKHTVGEAVNRINGESLRNGLYVLQVRVGDEIVFGKFMVQK